MGGQKPSDNDVHGCSHATWRPGYEVALGVSAIELESCVIFPPRDHGWRLLPSLSRVPHPPGRQAPRAQAGGRPAAGQQGGDACAQQAVLRVLAPQQEAGSPRAVW
jgi:hypothetical protein